MRLRTLGLGVALVALLSGGAAARAADAKCAIELLGEMKVDFARDRPTLDASIDGHPIRALADTGAGVTLISSGAVRAFGLRADDLAGEPVHGVGGNSRAQLAFVKELKVGSYTGHGMRMLAGGGSGMDVGMLLGQDFWGQADAEFDLSHGTIKILRPNRECKDEDVAYWVKPGQAYAVAPMAGGENSRRRVVVTVQLNGKPVRAVLDSGAQRSVATLRVAERIGLKERAAAGAFHGVGSRTVESYVAKLDSFTVGDETINNTRLLFGDLFAGVGQVELGSRIARGAEDAPEMLLGADFLRSHHVLMSQSRHAVYFTYEGGPVFDTRPPTVAPVVDPAPAVQAAPVAAAAAPPGP